MTTTPELMLPKEIAGIRIPDSRLATTATQLALETSTRVLFNHVVRTYVFGALGGRKLDMRFDEELLYVSAVLHDLGLTDRFAGAERFEVDGADAARTFVLAHDMSKENAAIVWDAIALHTTTGISHRKEPEVALVGLGAGLDVVGAPGLPWRFDVGDLPKEKTAELFDTLPRLGLGREITAAIARVLATKPHTGYFNMMADIGERHVAGYQSPKFCDVVAKSVYRD